MSRVVAVHSVVETLLLLCYVVSSAAGALHALLTKSDPRSAIGWIGVCCLLPYAGPLLYWLLGVNRVRRRRQPDPSPLQDVPGPAVLGYSAALAGQARLGNTLTRRPLAAGNSVEPLHNGELAFPRMLQAIAAARHSVWLATYIFQTDAVGREFVSALGAAVRRGVSVRVLVDGIGEWYDWPHVVPLLRRAGVAAARFLPPRLIPPNLSLNCRNHRKILLIDAGESFIGGMNLGGREVGGATGRRMTDIHFYLRGPVVTQLADTFAADWEFATGERLARQAASHAAESSSAGSSVCRVITGGPDEDVDKLLLVLVGAISTAQQQVQIMTPYFIPPPELVAALQAAALRGVTVSLVLPRRSNLQYIDWATLHWLPALVARGVQVHFQEPPCSHAKLFVVDGQYAHIGSVNVDIRSLRLNFEIAVEVFDAILCAELSRFIGGLQSRAPALTPEGVSQMPLLARIRNGLCWLVSPYL
jgi:cardiolipin synthase A/B